MNGPRPRPTGPVPPTVDPTPFGIDWPRLLHFAALLGVAVYRIDDDGYPERITEPPVGTAQARVA